MIVALLTALVLTHPPGLNKIKASTLSCRNRVCIGMYCAIRRLTARCCPGNVLCG